ncbi:ABC transporter family substrate-binding protein [Pseudokineococcus sp. 1T1Z-3]|uniref:ABC transporter family substrate-binding protein n=1 Tax=Pseudokineococcus sp. 1T1Z-3 TaxID=3132745 RepID=UPI00309A9F63
MRPTRRRLAALGAAATATTLALTACGTGDGGAADDSDGLGTGSSIQIAWNQSFYEYNDDTATGNATANAIILYLMNSGFNYYDDSLELVRDESFGTYELVGEDPLTVEYTINEDVTWSDGTPVDAADMVLYWASLSGRFNTLADEEVEVDAETGEALNVENEVYFNSTLPGVSYIEDVEVSEDGQGVTLTYDREYADWEVNFGVGVPAHVVAGEALGIDDPAEAKQALLDAVENNDTAALAPISEFYNTGFQFDQTLPDNEALYLSNGAYLLTEFNRDQFLTLEANPDYTGDRPAALETVTVRYISDPQAAVQALENGEVDVIEPQATTDIVQAAEGLGDGFETILGDGATFEHIDLAFDNAGPFDPATYGGDADIARDVREAFLLLIPREDILTTLIEPLNPEAVVRQSHTTVPGSPGYDEIVAGNGSDAYPVEVTDESIQRATDLLESAGVQTPIDVRLLTAADNPRRQNQVAIISETVNETGLFQIVDASSATWGEELADTSLYDAAMFGWQSTSTAVTGSNPNFITGASNNFYGYSNEQVDALLEELAVTTDPDRQVELLTQAEAELWSDAFGTVLYQHPAVDVYRTNFTGIAPIALSPTVFWNYWEWGTS